MHFYKVKRRIKKKLEIIKARKEFLPEKIAGGDRNSDKIFYVIRRENSIAGLCSYLITTLGHMQYAISKGYIPIIDMMNFENPYLEESEYGKVNAWELYFKQPYSLKEVYESQNVYLSCLKCLVDRPDDSMDFFNNRHNVIQKWHEIYVKNIVVRDEVLMAIDEEYKMLVEKEDRVLGVLCRGTDYTKNKPKFHPVQPDIKAVIQKAEEVMLEQNCNKLFLATEDNVIFKEFEKAFGKKIISNTSIRIDNFTGQWIAELKNERPKDNYLKGLEYFTTISILAKCNCFIGGRTSGSVMALIMSGKYEYTYFWDLGRYK